MPDHDIFDEPNAWHDWTSECFVWDQNWEGYWEVEDLGHQLQGCKQWFAILARLGNYMIIIYLTFMPHASRRNGYYTTRMFQAEILVGEEVGIFLWTLRVEWN